MHTEEHEEVILNHIDGSLDEKNVTEAVSLIRDCSECKDIYENSLVLRSKFQHTNIQSYLEKKSKRKIEAEKPKHRLGETFLWRQLATAAMLAVIVALPLGLYVHKLREDLAQKEADFKTETARVTSELTRIGDENEKLRTKVKDLGDIASLQALPKIFSSPYSFLLALSDIRSQESQPDKVISVKFPPHSDLLHLVLSISEERPSDNYRVFVLDNSMQVISKIENVKKDSFGNFNLYFSKQLIKDSAYVIEVYAIDRGKSNLVGKPSIRLRE